METRAKACAFGTALGVTAVLLAQLLVPRQIQSCQTCQPEADGAPITRGTEASKSLVSIPFLEVLLGASNIDSSSLIASLNKRYSSGSILVIGANVGDTWNDPLWAMIRTDRTFHKVFVEPIPVLFKQLEKNVAAANMTNASLVNAAISDTTSERDMYCWKLTETGDALGGMPGWFSQLCSFHRERLTSNPYDTGRVKVPRALRKSENIVKYIVPTLTVAALLQKYNTKVRDIRYVQIDTEGFDFHVLEQLPFDDPLFRPAAIVYEDVLLSEPQKHFLREKFHQCGYILKRDKQNIVGCRVLD